MREPARPRAPRPRLPAYVVDSHTLYWYLHDPGRLSQPAAAALDSVAAGGAQAFVPAIVVAEVYYLTAKLGSPVPPEALLAALDNTPGFAFAALGRSQLELLAQLTSIGEMHDRLIAAEALVHQAVVVTRDPVIGASGLIPTVW